MESDQSGRMPGVTAVILAAGENTRLKGLVAPYQKPLLLINGLPLVKHAMNHARNEWNARDYVIVCSPNNARELTSICGEVPRYVLQPTPSGVVNAIRLGLLSVHTERALIMCADNIFECLPGHEPNVKPEEGLIGTSVVEDKRFTTLRVHESGMIVEDNDYAENVSWLGPIFHNTEVLLQRALGSDVKTFVNSLPFLFSFPMNCSDLGVPEAL